MIKAIDFIKENIDKDVNESAEITFKLKNLCEFIDRYHAQKIKILNLPYVSNTEGELFCRDCIHNKATSYASQMWCRDCRQKDRFEAK